MISLFKKSIKHKQTEYIPLRRPVDVEFVDIHCHCLAGIDDGPVDIAGSVALCRALRLDGITRVIATPHQLGRYELECTPEKIRTKIAELNSLLQSESIDLKVLPGGDVRVDERLVQMIEEDRVLTLADGGKYILLELPHEAFVDITSIIDILIEKGIVPIISHPERHYVLASNMKILDSWLKKGAMLQVTAGSLLGEFGRQAENAAWSMLRNNMVQYIATDAHDNSTRRPRMLDAYNAISQTLGASVAKQLCVENPLKIVARM